MTTTNVIGNNGAQSTSGTVVDPWTHRVVPASPSIKATRIDGPERFSAPTGTFLPLTPKAEATQILKRAYNSLNRSQHCTDGVECPACPQKYSGSCR